MATPQMAEMQKVFSAAAAGLNGFGSKHSPGGGGKHENI